MLKKKGERVQDRELDLGFAAKPRIGLADQNGNPAMGRWFSGFLACQAGKPG